MGLPSFQSYANYANKSSAYNSLQFFLPNVTLWFSYGSLVAFKPLGNPTIISENIWGNTSGKHINLIEPNKKNRIPRELFKLLWDEFESTGMIANYPSQS